MKTCSGNWQSCKYAQMSSSCYIDCTYHGYCKYQLPNNPYFGTNNKQEGV